MHNLNYIQKYKLKFLQTSLMPRWNAFNERCKINLAPHLQVTWYLTRRMPFKKLHALKQEVYSIVF